MTTITSGKYKGRKISSTKQARPTLGKVRTSIFNSISSYVEGSSVLDLFAGSGSLGIEAISRGASKATFVDKDIKSVFVIKKNLEDLKVSEETKVIKNDYISFLTRLISEKNTFDLVFIDPPYFLTKNISESLIFKMVKRLLNADKSIKVLVLEIETQNIKPLQISLEGFITKIKSFGGSSIVFYINKNT